MEITIQTEIESKFLRYLLSLSILAIIIFGGTILVKIIKIKVSFQSALKVYALLVVVFTVFITYQFFKEKQIERATFKTLDETYEVTGNPEPSFTNIKYALEVTYSPASQFRRRKKENWVQGYSLFVGNYNKLPFEGDIELYLIQDPNIVQEKYQIDDIKLKPFEKKKVYEFTLKEQDWHFDSVFLNFDGSFLLDTIHEETMTLTELPTNEQETNIGFLSSYFIKTEFSNVETLLLNTVTTLKERSQISKYRYDLYLGNEGQEDITGDLQLNLYQQEQLIHQITFENIQITPNKTSYFESFYLNEPFDDFKFKLTIP